MKQTWKKLTGLFLSLAFMLTLFAVPVRAANQVTDEVKQSMVSQIQSIVEQMAQAGRDDMKGYLNQSVFTNDMVDKFYDAMDEAGTFEKVNDSSVDVDEEKKTATVKLEVSFEKYDAVITAKCNYASTSSDIDEIWSAFNVDLDYPMSVLMEQAGLNTLMGLCIVFIMLIFLSFVISLFKHVNKIGGTKEKKAAPAAPAPAPKAAASAAPAAVETSGGMAEDEIAVVIAAAIAAYEGEHGGGDDFVVRSIKKVNRKSWKRA